MDDLVIDDLDDNVVERLSVRAARNGRDLEDEVREILRAAVADELPAAGGGADTTHQGRTGTSSHPRGASSIIGRGTAL